jgi:hypothetical protein
MEIQEQHHNDGNEYAYSVILAFEDLQTDVKFEVPVQGVIRVNLSGEFPFPTTVDIKQDMIAGKNDDASYVEFDRLNQTVADSSESPIEFRFITKPAPPSERYGAKVYSFKTSEYEPETNIAPDQDPNIIEHHIGIPSSQRVRLIASITNAIFRSETQSNDIPKMTDIYDADRSSAVDKFYDDIKKYGSFEAEIKVLGFLIDTGDMYRDSSATVNKVAKQVTRKRLRRQLQSADDIRRFVSIINSEDSLPDITVEEVFDEVYERVDGNKKELEQIAEALDVDTWSSLY